MRRLSSALLVASFVLASCTSINGVFERPLSELLEEHVTILASDEFEGRAAGAEGFDKAASYVVSQLESYGVEPGTENWRQPVPLVAVDTESIRGTLSIIAGDEILELQSGEDVGFYPPSDGVGEGYRAEASGGIVFVGDGVVWPDKGMDPYAGVDVRGKLVAMFRGAPPLGDNATEVHARRFDVKRAEAVRRGAVGVLYLDPRDRDVSRLSSFRASHPKGSLAVGAGFDQPVPTAMIRLDIVRKLFEVSGQDLDATLEALKTGEAESFEMEAVAALSTQADALAIDAYNIIGVIPGTDPTLSQEAVILTAHLDHLRMRIGSQDVSSLDEAAGEDLINNGAVDNAVGVSIIMEVAAQIAKQGGLSRTLIVSAVTAEEAGLLGSMHLARNLDDLGYDTIANVNVDMPVLTYPLNDVIGFGEAYSTLGEPLRAAAAEVGLVATPDPLPELGLFARSDHYSFVQQGIPALFLFNGMSGEGRENFQAFMRTHYHRPSDEVTLPINWEDGAKLTRMTVDLVTRIANDPARPEWFDGVVFAPRPVTP
ncbi:MAG: M28 family peptidase [Parvularculaceae bacterium]|nr:M28 family peptidase [Parvularculaceae bacterium]